MLIHCDIVYSPQDDMWIVRANRQEIARVKTKLEADKARQEYIQNYIKGMNTFMKQHGG